MNRGASTLRTILIVFGSSWITLLINLIRVSVVPMSLGDTGMGQVTLASSFTNLFFALAVLGTSNYLVRAVARDQSLLDSYISNALVLRVVTGTLILGIIIGVANLFGYSSQTQQVILIVGVAMVILTISNVFESGLQAIGQMSWRSIAMAVSNISMTVVGVGLLFAGADVITYVICIPLGSLLQLGIVLAYYFRHRPIKFSVDFSIGRALLVGGMPLFIWAFLQTAYGQIDATILSLFASESVVGWLGVAMQITGVLIIIPISINAVSMPMLCELYVKLGDQFQRFATRTILSTLVLLVPLGAGLAISADVVIDLLPYPQSFVNAIVPLALMGLALPVTGILMVLGAMAMAIGQERQWVKISIMGVFLAPPLFIGFIWFFQTNLANGAIGSALANLTGECALLVWAWFVLPKELRLSLHDVIGKGVQIVSLASCMSIVVLFLKMLGMHFLLYIPAGAIVYCAGAWMLKLITPGDLQLVRSAVLRRRSRAEAVS